MSSRLAPDHRGLGELSESTETVWDSSGRRGRRVSVGSSLPRIRRCSRPDQRPGSFGNSMALQQEASFEQRMKILLMMAQSLSRVVTRQP